MFRKTIAKLRQQPRGIRDAVSFWCAGGFAFVVALVWLFNAPERFSEIMVSDVDRPEQTSFFDEISSQVANVREAIPDTTQAADSSTAQPINSAPENESLETLLDTFRTNAQANLAGVSSSTSSSTDVATPEQSDSEVNLTRPDSERREVRIQTVPTATSTSSQ